MKMVFCFLTVNEPAAGAHDLVVLSTCNNGTPEMAGKLQEVTDLLLASPKNLHLSHIDPGQLSLLEATPDISANNLAEAIAEETFRRLSKSIRTVITLSIYDLGRITPYIDHFNKLTDLYGE